MQLLPKKNDGGTQHISKSSFFVICLSKEEQCYLSVPLKEEEMIEDLLHMAHDTREMCKKQGLPSVCVTVPLSGNRLLLNDHVIYPNTPCLVRNGSSGARECVFVSTTVKDKDLREKRKDSSFRITMGATPHHALLSAADAENHSLYLKMNPPLRSEEDRKAVFSALLDGTIDWAESDHAPHTIEDKEKGASGIPGLPGMLLLLSELRKAGCSEKRLEAIFGMAAAAAFGLSDYSENLPSDAFSLFAEISSEYIWNPYADFLK